MSKDFEIFIIFVYFSYTFFCAGEGEGGKHERKNERRTFSPDLSHKLGLKSRL
jgi:hypothetical protein